METEFTKLSSRGQIVIPQALRDEMGLKEGTPFAITGRENIIVLRAIDLTAIEKEWDSIFAEGRRFAKEKGIKPGDVQRAIDEIRR